MNLFLSCIFKIERLHDQQVMSPSGLPGPDMDTGDLRDILLTQARSGGVSRSKEADMAGFVFLLE